MEVSDSEEEIDINEAQTNSKTIEQNCLDNYKADKRYQEQMDKENVNNFLVGLSNIVIVSLFMHLLNKKSK